MAARTTIPQVLPCIASPCSFALGFSCSTWAGPADVLSSASRVCRALGLAGGYVMTYVSLTPGPVQTAAGLSVHADPVGPADTLVVPGVLEDPNRVCPPPLRALLADWPARLVSVCTGSWKLAEAGRLTGRRAATHWMFAAEMAARFPEVTVDGEALWVEDDGVWTSAGVSAGMDLALALVEADFGRALALQVARLLVMPLKRSGDARQFSDTLRAQVNATGRIGELVAWMDAHPASDHRVEELAKRVHMSPRTFARRFRERTGSTPARMSARLRFAHARRLLEEGRDLSLTEVAARSGLGSAESLRRRFHAELGVSPAAYRARFRSTS